MKKEMGSTSEHRVVIDAQPNGDYHVYSDPDVEVIVRCPHVSPDELYRYGHRPIPEEWLRDKQLGFRGDGSEAEELAGLIGEALRAARKA